MKLGKVLVVYTTPRTKEQKNSLNSVQDILKEMKIKSKFANRDSLKYNQFAKRDMVIAVGGDGTFLRAAQFVKNGTIMGVNADVKSKEGFFLKSNKRNFKYFLESILLGKRKIKKLPRLEARLDGKKLPSFALNEFFIGPSKPYHASKYIIKVSGKSERHKSSGILVATPAGSHAWVSASGGKKMPLSSQNIQYKVREPYTGKIFKGYKLTNGILKHGQKITIISEMLDGVIVADSVGREHRIRHGQKVEISVSSNFLNVFWS